MFDRGTARAAVVACAVILGGAVLMADTLVLRNGRRVQGTLVSVRNGLVEFDQAGFGSQTMRVSLREVRSIEFDDEWGGNRGGGGRPGDRPSGMRERTVTVAARTALTDTGIDVRAGQTVYVEATGTVEWGPGRRDGPEGERNSPENPARPIPGRPAASLIGQVGRNTDDFFFIGADSGPMRMRSGGRLFLGINDDYLQDNRGSFRVTVYY